MKLSRRAVLMRDTPLSATGAGAMTLPPAAAVVAPKPSLSVAALAEAAFSATDLPPPAGTAQAASPTSAGEGPPRWRSKSPSQQN